MSEQSLYNLMSRWVELEVLPAARLATNRDQVEAYEKLTADLGADPAPEAYAW